MTPTTVGWVLTDGHDTGGPTLAQAEISVRQYGDGVDAVRTSERATAAVLHLRAAMEAHGQRLRGIGVTWSGDTAAEAALLFESLADAGFDNVVPVRFRQAAESLAGNAAPPSGTVEPAAKTSERKAVCLIESGLATVLTVDGGNDDAPTVVQQAIDDLDDAVGWLAALFAPAGRRPATLILSGAQSGLCALAARLETRLGLPVTIEAGARLALARGAAQALGADSEFTDVLSNTEADEGTSPGPARGRSRPAVLPYAGALTMLVVGVLTFVVSVSMALSLHLTADDDTPRVDQVAKSEAGPVIHPHSTPAAAAPSAETPEPPTEPAETATTLSPEPDAAPRDDQVPVSEEVAPAP